MHDEVRDRSTADLVKELASETSTLVRQEMELAKAEMAQKGKQAAVGAGMFAGTAVAGLLALGALTACLILALALAVPGWLAALIVALVWAAVGGALAFVARKRVREATPPKPERTVESVKEDVEAVKRHASGGRS